MKNKRGKRAKTQFSKLRHSCKMDMKRERERETERDRDRERQRDRDREREREIERDTHTHTHTHREREREQKEHSQKARRCVPFIYSIRIAIFKEREIGQVHTTVQKLAVKKRYKKKNKSR